MRLDFRFKVVAQDPIPKILPIWLPFETNLVEFKEIVHHFCNSNKLDAEKRIETQWGLDSRFSGAAKYPIPEMLSQKFPRACNSRWKRNILERNVKYFKRRVFFPLSLVCFNTSTGQNFGVKMQTVKKCEFAVFKKMRLGLWCALATLHALMCGHMRMTSEITRPASSIIICTLSWCWQNYTNVGQGCTLLELRGMMVYNGNWMFNFC